MASKAFYAIIPLDNEPPDDLKKKIQNPTHIRSMIFSLDCKKVVIDPKFDTSRYILHSTNIF